MIKTKNDLNLIIPTSMIKVEPFDVSSLYATWTPNLGLINYFK